MKLPRHRFVIHYSYSYKNVAYETIKLVTAEDEETAEKILLARIAGEKKAIKIDFIKYLYSFSYDTSSNINHPLPYFVLNAAINN